MSATNRPAGNPGRARRLLAAAAPALSLGVFLYFFLPLRRFLGVENPAIGAVAAGFLRHIPALLRRRLSVLALPPVDGFKHGPGEYYITAPFVLLFGHTRAAMLWRDGFFACLALLMTYLLGRVLYRDRWAAFLAGLILAASPGFVLYSALGVLTGEAEAALAAACLYFLLRYADERRPWLAYAGFAVLGLALDGRSTMAAFLIGLIAYACVYRREVVALMPAEPAERRRFAGKCVLSFLLFVSPFMIACASHPREFWSYFADRFVVREESGSNLDYGRNLLLRLRQLSALLKGKDCLHFFVENPDRYPASGEFVLALALLAAGIGLLLFLIRRRPAPRRWTLPWIVAIGYLLASPFSPSRLRVMHLLPLLPLACLAACSAVALPVRARLRAALIAAFLLFVAVRIAGEARFFRRFYAELARVGIWEPNLSSGSLELADWFSKRPQAIPVVFGGPAQTLIYLSGGRIPARVFGGTPELPTLTSRKEWDSVLGIKGACFVVVADPHPAYSENRPLEALKLEASRRRLGLALVETIDRPDGAPLFAVYQVVR